MTKMTYTQALEVAINVLSADAEQNAIVERLNALKATLDKRANTPRKPSKAELAKMEQDAKDIERITAILSGVEGATCKEIAEELGDLSVPKVAALLRKMGAMKTEERTPVYSLPVEGADAE